MESQFIKHPGNFFPALEVTLRGQGAAVMFCQDGQHDGSFVRGDFETAHGVVIDFRRSECS
jgi:hypothetical protein